MSDTRTKKEIKKSESIGIRYNLKKFKIATSRSGEKRIQGLFDFLLDFYLNATGGIFTPHSVAQVNAPYVSPAKPLSPYEAYEKEISEAISLEQLSKIGDSFDRDSDIKGISKAALKALADKRAKEIQP